MSSNCQPSILFKARAMKFGQTRVWPTDRDSARALASVGESAAEADGGRRPRQARSIATCELSFGLDMVKQSWDSSIHSPRPGYPPLNLSTEEYLTLWILQVRILCRTYSMTRSIVASSCHIPNQTRYRCRPARALANSVGNLASLEAEELARVGGRAREEGSQPLLDAVLHLDRRVGSAHRRRHPSG